MTELKNNAHDQDPHAQRFGAGSWSPPRPDAEPYGYPFRKCGYCGSIQPQDLLDAIRAGARLECADLKYGWPHKFYVEGIPNPQAGKIVECGSSSVGGVTQPIMSPAPATTTCKFYNTHLKDCPPDLFASLREAILAQTGFEFVMDEKGLGWRKVR